MERSSTLPQLSKLSSPDAIHWLLGRDATPTGARSYYHPALSQETSLTDFRSISLTNAYLVASHTFAVRFQGGSEDVLHIPLLQSGTFVLGTVFYLKPPSLALLLLAAGRAPTHNPPTIRSRLARFVVDLNDPRFFWMAFHLSDSTFVLVKHVLTEFGMVSTHWVLCDSPHTLPLTPLAETFGCRFCPYCIERKEECQCSDASRQRHWVRPPHLHRRTWGDFLTWCHSVGATTKWGKYEAFDRTGRAVFQIPSLQITEYHGSACPKLDQLKEHFVRLSIEAKPVENELPVLDPALDDDHDDAPANKSPLHASSIESDQPRAELHLCEYCTKEFTTRSNLFRHQRMKHKDSVPRQARDATLVDEKAQPCLCPFCPKRFHQRWNLRRHILAVHEKRKSHFCDICDMSFAQRENRDRHIRLRHMKRDG